YTIGDLLMLLVTVRLLVAAPRRPAMLLLTIGAFGALAGDVWYSLDQLHDGWQPGNWGEACYVVFYFAWGAAALHPSMKGPTSDVPIRTKQLSGWTGLLGLAIGIPPATLLAESLVGPVRDGVVIAATSVVTFALVVTRLVDAVGDHRAAMARERALRV